MAASRVHRCTLHVDSVPEPRCRARPRRVPSSRPCARRRPGVIGPPSRARPDAIGHLWLYKAHAHNGGHFYTGQGRRSGEAAARACRQRVGARVAAGQMVGTALTELGHSRSGAQQAQQRGAPRASRMRAGCASRGGARPRGCGARWRGVWVGRAWGEARPLDAWIVRACSWAHTGQAGASTRVMPHAPKVQGAGCSVSARPEVAGGRVDGWRCLAGSADGWMGG
jgi:hypothetical protein